MVTVVGESTPSLATGRPLADSGLDLKFLLGMIRTSSLKLVRLLLLTFLTLAADCYYYKSLFFCRSFSLPLSLYLSISSLSPSSSLSLFLSLSFLGHGESTSTISWLPNHTNCLVAGMGSRFLRIFDIRGGNVTWLSRDLVSLKASLLIMYLSVMWLHLVGGVWVWFVLFYHVIALLCCECVW